MSKNLMPVYFNQNYKLNKRKLKMKKNAMDPVNFEEEKKNDPKYKTELCKSFIENNFCQYGNKCRFAHGENELVIKAKISNYKRKLCKSFFNEGFCPYGIRCNFRHDQRKLSDIKLPFYYINLLVFHKPKLISGKRLKIFEEITNTENILSDTTLSSSHDNSPNIKKEDNLKGCIDKNICEFFQNDNCKKLNFDINLNFNKKYQKEENINDNNQEKASFEKDIFYYIFNGINDYV